MVCRGVTNYYIVTQYFGTRLGNSVSGKVFIAATASAVGVVQCRDHCASPLLYSTLLLTLAAARLAANSRPGEFGSDGFLVRIDVGRVLSGSCNDLTCVGADARRRLR